MTTGLAYIQPNPGPQTAFLACDHFEVLFGGALGPGKSWALVVDPLAHVGHPKFRGLILRRTFPELRELISRSREIYPLVFPGAKYNQTEKVWTFPSGATLEFGYLKHESDIQRYWGQEYTWIGFDELTHFEEYQYTMLKSRIRTTAPDLKCYVRATCNPKGKGHAWVRARFIEAGPAMAEIYDPKTGQVRVFIPALLKDNPHLAGTDYEHRLGDLGDRDQEALVKGNWYAYEGDVFQLVPGVHLWDWDQLAEYGDFTIPDDAPVPQKFVPADWKLYRVMDWGYARPFCVLWVAVDPKDRAFVVAEWAGEAKDNQGVPIDNQGIRMEPEAVAAAIVEKEKAFGFWDTEKDRSRCIGVADPSIWAKGRGDMDGGPSIEEKMGRHKVWWAKGKNDRVNGWMEVQNRLAFKAEDDGTILEYPSLVFVDAPYLRRTLPGLEPDEHNPEDINTDSNDHGADAVRYFCMARPLAPRKKPEMPKWLKGRKPRRSGWVV